MTTEQMIIEYAAEIARGGGEVPCVWNDPRAMQIAKLQDAWRKLQ